MSKSLLFAALAVISISFCFGQVPQTLSYQGLLTDNSGAALTDGSYAVTFRFYSENGSLITSRGPLTVNTFKGLFMITLGDGTTDNAALPFSLADQEFFVGITVSPSTIELTPRVKVTAVPYAFVAQVANSVPVGTTAERPGSLVEGQIRYNSTEKVMEYSNGTDWYFVTHKICILTHQESSTTLGGSATAGAWTTRKLTHSYGETSMLIAFKNGDNHTSFQLKPGEYIIEICAPAHGVYEHQVRLSDGSGPLGVGTSTRGVGLEDGGSASLSNLIYQTTYDSNPRTFVISQKFNALAEREWNLGWPSSTGESNIYMQVKITKLR